MISRVVTFLLALPLLVVGAYGLGTELAPHAAWVGQIGEPLRAALERVGQGDRLALVEGRLAGGGAVLAGLVLLLVTFRPRGSAHEDARSRPIAQVAAGAPARTDRKAEKRAQAMARKGDLVGAAELCAEAGMHDAAVGWFVKAEEYARAAELRQDQNRLGEAAELFLRGGDFDTAGSLFASRNEYARAADAYRKGGRMSVAAEMYEKASRFLDAGHCYMDCEFYRYAAQAYLKVQDWVRAAKALEKAVHEESGGVGLQVAARNKEFRKLVIQAAKLYEESGDLEASTRVLEEGECFGAAGEMAMRAGLFEKAARYFERSGSVEKAAEALRALGEDAAAAQIMGEFLRGKGESDDAARLLAEAGDFAAAGEIYQQLQDFTQAGECYERCGDSLQAGEMFRQAGAWGRALACYERVQRYVEAAECAAQMGDAARRGELLARGGRPLEAASVYAEQGLEDEAIKVLQQVSADHAEFQDASATLGRIFARKRKYGLAVKKLEQAIAGRELEAGNTQLFYDLARVYEAAGNPAKATELYEKILAADYHFKDVEQRLETTRTLVQASSPPPDDAGTGTGGSSSRPGRYRIVSELGRGGMGIVYKAEDTVLDRPVAFKVLPDALRDNPQALTNFLREAKSAASLNHPNIVTVYDAGEQDGRYYIAMEYVDGTTLKEIVRRRGAIAPKGVVHVVLQMCEALQFAHDHKVVHRDIKTANTMWTRDKKAKIMDFGLAKVVEEVRNHTTLVSGTPYYMSPEQTLGKNVDHRTDLYSLGVTIFELATGTLPFTEGNVPYHHVHTPAPDPRSVNPEVPEALARLIDQCLEKDPADRPQNARDIAARLREEFAR